MTDTGTPSAASSACAASRTSGRVAGLVISVRRLPKPNSGSTPTVRAGSRPSLSAVLETSLPKGATKQTESGAGFSVPAIIFSNSGTAHVDAGFLTGKGFSGTGTAVPSLPYWYQPRPVLRPSRPAATRGSTRKDGRYFSSS